MQEETQKPLVGKALGILFILIGAVLAIGGIWLITLGGSLYYAIIGTALVVSGVYLYRGNTRGINLYWLILLATFLWTAWESGSNYWRWVPRLGLFVVLGLLLALALPYIHSAISRKFSYRLSGAFVAVFAVAFGLAFVPHGITKGVALPEEGSISAAADTAGNATQPAAISKDGDWTSYGQSDAALRYVTSKQITPENIGKLKKAWVFRTGDIPEESWGAETTPLKVGNTMYLCSARNKMFALNAETGEQLWSFDPHVSNESIAYTASCRSVVYYETPESQICKTRIIEGTIDTRIIAVNAQTGVPCADFGKNGEIDLNVGMGDYPKGYIAITSPPAIIRGVIVTGQQILDGQRRDAPSGVIRGFDVVTGELRWAWDMKRPDLTGLPPVGEKYSPGTPNSWTIPTGDEKLGLVYLPTGNAANDYVSDSRSEPENKYSTALVAINAETGKVAWHFQTVHKDVWDYDMGSQVSLLDFPTKNGKVPAVIVPTKQGEIFVLNRQTGEPVVGVEERPVPQGGVETALRSPTQPHSLYASLNKADLTEQDMWGLSPFDQLYCRIRFKEAAYSGRYTAPTTDRPYIQYPSFNGGSDWGSVSIDPSRGVLVANYNDMPNYNRLITRAESDAMGLVPRGLPTDTPARPEGAGPQVGSSYGIDINAGWRLPFTRLLCKEPPYGGIRAMNLVTGETIWDRPFGTARNNGPFGIASHLPIEIGTPNNGGSVVTASGLIFIAAATDNLFRAIDIKTGDTIWKDVLPAGGQANPMSYEINGKQYVVIVAGGHHVMETPVGDYVIAYALSDD